MLKNLTVVTQRVKNKSDGLGQYSNYLLNQNAKSHKNTEIIDLHPLSNDPKGYINNFLVENISNTIEFDLNNKKGGRKVESYGQSLVFSLPSGFPPPTKEQWKNIYLDIFKEVSKHLITKKDGTEIKLNNTDLKDIFTLSLGVAHNQKNPHLNVVIPRIIKQKTTGELVRLDNIDRKSFLNSAKSAFNASALKHLALDFKSYEPENTNTGKSLRPWQKQQQQAAAAQEAAELAQAKASEMIVEAKKAEIEASKLLTEVDNKQFQFNKFKDTFNSLLDTIKFYLSNVTKKAKEEDKKKIEEDYNKISSNDLFEDTHQEIIEKTAEIVDMSIEEEEEKITPVVKRRRRKNSP